MQESTPDDDGTLEVLHTALTRHSKSTSALVDHCAWRALRPTHCSYQLEEPMHATCHMPPSAQLLGKRAAHGRVWCT